MALFSSMYPVSRSMPHSLLTTHRPPSFLASTHYTNYNPWLFAINLTALVFALLPKFPQVRQVSLLLYKYNLSYFSFPLYFFSSLSHSIASSPARSLHGQRPFRRCYPRNPKLSSLPVNDSREWKRYSSGNHHRSAFPVISSRSEFLHS